MLWIIILLCGMLVLCVYCFSLRIPDSRYGAVGITDFGEREIYYFVQKTVAEKQDDIFYEYGCSETSMYRFDGNTIVLEVLRDGVSSILLGLLTGRMISVVIVASLTQKKEGNRNKRRRTSEREK